MKSKVLSVLLLLFFVLTSCVSAQTNAEEFEKIFGRWFRSDGGYVLVIDSVDDQGNLQAVYLNPRPINVSQAEIIKEEDEEYIYVELQDTGYPGSNYKLKYDAETDRLVGVYYHAVLKQRFDIFFIREESKKG
jgi:hypothetical protein